MKLKVSPTQIKMPLLFDKKLYQIKIKQNKQTILMNKKKT